MRNLKYIVAFSFAVAFIGCKSSSTTNSEAGQLEERLDDKNRIALSLLNRIQKLPSISIQNGLPFLTKGSNSMEGNNEPLYVLDDYVVGNSFRSVNGLVESFNVKKVEVLTESDASIYGSRAGSGVIKITTYQ